MWEEAIRASDDEITKIISYINTFLDRKIAYGERYSIDDGIIDQLNKIPNCEAYRVVNDDRLDLYKR